MKISISYPPIESEKGTPLLGQNRQFQWFNSPTYIYPMVPAYAATLLKANGYDVFWDDGIAEELSYEEWLKRIIQEKPDLVAIETKTPVIKRHWRIINELKVKSSKLKVVLMGDHVTALPEESLKNSQVDYVLTGGDYDFMLLNLANHLTKGEKLKPGWYYRSEKLKVIVSKTKVFEKLEKEKFSGENDKIVSTGHFQLNHDLNTLPFIDRELTKWKLYAYKNGNFKYPPGTYMMSGRDCWWGKCFFCSWTTLFPGANFRVRSAKLALDEVGHLIDLGVKEIMEDSGTLPVGDWLKEFCQGMIERGYNKKVTLSCNMRINGIKSLETWRLLKRAGFRMILFGLESANQETLTKINKGLKVEEIEPGLKMCKEAGLEPHITAMMGFPWETKKDAQKTIDLAKRLFKKGSVDTLQATIIIPYPGTPLYKYCKENNLLNFNDYDRFDQREQVMKSELTTEDVKELTQSLYKSFASPQFILRKVFSIRNVDDAKFLARAGMKLLGHLTDFGK
ncbi:B12-binding domain-containing radical SAM protein [Patescibacteria group bacterium]|nr:B12-binding domain-containing radical SAM protein [Patescibacteria group bacterium]